MKTYKVTILVVMAFVTTSCLSQTNKMKKEDYPINKSDSEWKAELTAEEYNILREQGTERAFTGKYWQNTEDGNYYCAGCNQKLFSSDTKYKSGSGWPSFWDVMSNDSLNKNVDNTHGMQRVEVTCKSCGAHLGHVFEDGPEPTGLRYCINSISLDLKEH